MSATPAPGRGTAYAWYCVAVLLLISVFGYIDRLVISFLVDPIKAEMGFSDTQMGALTGGAFALFFVLAGLPLGRLIDSRPRITILSICIGIWSLATTACGLVQNFGQFFAARCGVGAGEAGLHPAGVSLISDLFPRERVTAPIAIFSLGTYLGGGSAIILGGQLISYFATLPDISFAGFGPIPAWRMLFLVTGLPGLLLVLLLMFTFREPARGIQQSQPRTAAGSSTREAIQYLRQHRMTYGLLFCGLIAFGFYSYGLLAWQQVVLMRTYGMSPADVASSYGWVFLGAGLAGAFSSGLWVRILTRRGHIDAPAIVMCVGTGLAIPGAIAGPLMSSAGWSLACIALVIYAWALNNSLALVSIILVTPSRFRGTTTSLYVVAMNLTCGAAGPIVVGMLSDRVFGPENIRYSMATVAAIGVPAAAVLFGVLRPHLRSIAQHLAHERT